MRQDEDEIIALLADQLDDFKNKVIEEIKNNIYELLKDNIKKVVKEDQKEVEKLNTTVALLEMHVDNLKTQNTQLQERYSECKNKIDELEQYDRSLSLHYWYFN